jgi:DNA-binding transcriptional ArsR family regulator
LIDKYLYRITFLAYVLLLLEARYTDNYQCPMLLTYESNFSIVNLGVNFMNKVAATLDLDIILSALAHPKRRGMIDDLSLRPYTVALLANKYGLSLPAMHKHIVILEKSMLINKKKAGRTNFVALNQKTLSFVKDWIMKYHTEWGDPSATLDNYIAKMQE